jgi:hypothetical protein
MAQVQMPQSQNMPVQVQTTLEAPAKPLSWQEMPAEEKKPRWWLWLIIVIVIAVGIGVYFWMQ